jgi:hypothetical protein
MFMQQQRLFAALLQFFPTSRLAMFAEYRIRAE